MIARSVSLAVALAASVPGSASAGYFLEGLQPFVVPYCEGAPPGAAAPIRPLTPDERAVSSPDAESLRSAPWEARGCGEVRRAPARTPAKKPYDYGKVPQK